jgi:hypothetical protein
LNIRSESGGQQRIPSLSAVLANGPQSLSLSSAEAIEPNHLFQAQLVFSSADQLELCGFIFSALLVVQLLSC